MASSWLGVDAPNIAHGWAPEPQLSAPNIGELVKSILANKLARDKMTQENIADTIKQIQQQRASKAYLAGAQQAGVIPWDVNTEGFGPYGGQYGSDLAKRVAEVKQQADLDKYHTALAGEATAHGNLYQTQSDYIDEYGTILVYAT